MNHWRAVHVPRGTDRVNEATMLYVMASDILGSHPPDVGECGEGDNTPFT